MRLIVRAWPRGERLHDVAARDGADQASVPAHDGDRFLGGDGRENGVQPAFRLDDGLPEIEQAGDGLGRPGGGEPLGEDAADQPPVPVGDEPNSAARPTPCAAERGPRLGHRLRGREHGGGAIRDLIGAQHGGQIDMLDEALDILGRGAGHDVLGLADLNHLAILHQDDAAAERDGLVEVVRDEDDGLLELALEVAQLRLHVAADQRVEGAEGLVHQKDVGIRREGAGEARPLLHAARQFVGILVLPAFQPDEFDRLHCTIGASLERNLPDFEAKPDIGQDRAVGEQREMLEHHAEGLLPERQQVLAVELRHVDIVDEDASAGRLDEPVHAAQEGRLSRARQAHQDQDFPLDDVEGDVAQPDDGAASFGDLALALALGYQFDRLSMI